MKREDTRRLAADTAGEEAYLSWLTANLSELPSATAPAGLSAAVQQRTGVQQRPPVDAALRLPALDLATVLYAGGRAAPRLRPAGHRAHAPRRSRGGLRGRGRSPGRRGGPARRAAGAPWPTGRRLLCRQASAAGGLRPARPGRVRAAGARPGAGHSLGRGAPVHWLAREVGSPGSARAVGQALGRNPVAPLIPCHRAVRRDGGLGGYAFGLPLKRRLLEQEGIDLAGLEQLATVGLRYLGSRTTQIYCFPTCRHARRIQPDEPGPLP